MPLISHAESALATLLAEYGDGYAFPSDAIWQHFAEMPVSTRRPGLIKSFEKAGLLVATGRMTKAITGARKGSPTKEYTFGAKISPSSLGLAQAGSSSDVGVAPSDVQFDSAVPLPAADGIFPLTHPLQRIVHGCPGSGKSYNLSKDAQSAHFVIRTVFHPETTYSDFVGGLRPQSIYREVDPKPVFIGATEEVPGEPLVQYVLQPGPLLKAYQIACLNPDLSVVLLIEEISRGVAAHIFGDTLQLLDRVQSNQPETGFSQYDIEPRPDVKSWLLYNEVWHDRVAAGFMRFPPNLYLWATMNRADQNARQLDAAFMRRWKKQYLSYLEKGALDEKLMKYGGSSITWGAIRAAINQKLADLESIAEDKFVGPYLLPFDHMQDPSDVFEDLWSYLWTDVLKNRAPTFFGTKTLGELKSYWDNGNGSPIGPISN